MIDTLGKTYLLVKETANTVLSGTAHVVAEVRGDSSVLFTVKVNTSPVYEVLLARGDPAKISFTYEYEARYKMESLRALATMLEKLSAVVANLTE